MGPSLKTLGRFPVFHDMADVSHRIGQNCESDRYRATHATNGSTRFRHWFE